MPRERFKSFEELGACRAVQAPPKAEAQTDGRATPDRQLRREAGGPRRNCCSRRPRGGSPSAARSRWSTCRSDWRAGCPARRLATARSRTAAAKRRAGRYGYESGPGGSLGGAARAQPRRGTDDRDRGRRGAHSSCTIPDHHGRGRRPLGRARRAHEGVSGRNARDDGGADAAPPARAKAQPRAGRRRDRGNHVELPANAARRRPPDAACSPLGAPGTGKLRSTAAPVEGACTHPDRPSHRLGAAARHDLPIERPRHQEPVGVPGCVEVLPPRVQPSVALVRPSPLPPEPDGGRPGTRGRHGAIPADGSRGPAARRAQGLPTSRPTNASPRRPLNPHAVPVGSSQCCANRSGGPRSVPAPVEYGTGQTGANRHRPGADGRWPGRDFPRS